MKNPPPIADWRAARPYVVLAVLFALVTGLCYVAQFYGLVVYYFGLCLGLDPALTAREAAVALVAMTALAASPSLREGVVKIRTLLAPPAKRLWDANRDATPTEDTWSLLGGLRFYLAFVVICTHLGHWCGYARWLTPITGMNATCAVMIFLVISGFSMGHSLEKKPGGFYQRRLKRLYPVYIAGLMLSLLPFVYGRHLAGPYWTISRPDWLTLLAVAFFLQTWVTVGVASCLQYWSLGVEAACYVIAPLLRRLPIWVAIAGAAVSGAFFWREPWPNPHFVIGGAQFLLYSWAWLIGWCLYYYRATHMRLAFLLALFFICRNTGVWSGLDYIWLPVFLSAILLAGRRVHLRSAARLFNWLGDLSYPLYCVQNAAFWLLWETTKTQESIWYILAALGLGAAVFYTVDLPWRGFVARGRNAPTGFRFGKPPVMAEGKAVALAK